MSSVPNGTTFIKNLSNLLRYEGLSPNAFANLHFIDILKKIVSLVQNSKVSLHRSIRK